MKAFPNPDERFAEPVTGDRVDLVCDAFEAAWQSGEIPKIEDYLGTAVGRERNQLLGELLGLEYEYLEVRRQIPERANYLKRFPEDTIVINEFFDGRTLTSQRNTTQIVNYQTSDGVASKKKSPAVAAVPVLLPGTILGGYELIERIGQGGMGVVFKARQLNLQRTVALKVIKPSESDDPNFVKRFESEATAAAQLHHPNIVPVYDVGEDAGRHFFSMGFVDGQTLSELSAEGPLNDQRAAEIIGEISDAMEVAHQHGLIHRDLKPANILLDRHGKPKVADFGLAKSLSTDSELTATGQILGTPGYMPPEQARGTIQELDCRADIYSIGAILYQLLTGRPPFLASTPYETVRQVIEETPVPPGRLNVRISRDLETICLKCLEKEPQRRFASCQELAAELTRFADGKPILTRPIGTFGKTWRWCRRNSLVATLLCLCVASLLIGIMTTSYFAVSEGRKAEQLKRSLKNASVARRRAAQAATEAERNADLARRQSEQIVKILEELIFDVADRLKTIPEARPARRDILQRGLASLELLSSEIKSADRAQKDNLRALLRLGDIFHVVGDAEGSNSTEKARVNFREAARIGQDLAMAAPSDLEVHQLWAEALEALGNLDFDSRQTQSAGQAFLDCLKIRREISDQLPADTPLKQRLIARWELLLALRNVGDFYDRVGEDEAANSALADAKRQGELLQQLFEGEDEESELKNQILIDYTSVLLSLGDHFLDNGQPDRAEPHYVEALKITQNISEELDTPLVHWELAGCLERIGELAFARNHMSEALAAYEQSLEHSLPIIEHDTRNIEYQLGLAISYCKIGKVNLRLGDANGVLAAYKKALEIRMPIYQADPANLETCRLVIDSYRALAAAEKMNGDQSAANERFVSALQIIESADSSIASALQPYVALLQRDIAALDL